MFFSFHPNTQVPIHTHVHTTHTSVHLSNTLFTYSSDFLLSFHSLNELLFSRSVVSNSLQPLGQQHTRLPCPSSSPRVCSNSCLLSQWRASPFMRALWGLAHFYIFLVLSPCLYRATVLLQGSLRLPWHFLLSLKHKLPKSYFLHYFHLNSTPWGTCYLSLEDRNHGYLNYST